VTPGSRTVVRPPHRSYDHRYARPYYRDVYNNPHAYQPAPRHVYYRPYYTRWWVHPWYRAQYSTTVVVSFDFNCYAWSAAWTPPRRDGYSWMPGMWVGSAWTPGYWAPRAVVPMGYAYVPGYWSDQVYVEGFYRVEQRQDGDWYWVDGYYLEDGTYVRGHWMPAKAGPEGYTWEAGFWDGEVWVDGFWRPEYRPGFTWVSSFYGDDGVFHTGYWAPLQDEPGFVWIQGWFDGTQWIEGYWVAETEYENTDLSTWQPDAGWDAGWEVDGFGDGSMLGTGAEVPVDPDTGALPLGLPVDIYAAP
jgi:hypothetical protein